MEEGFVAVRDEYTGNQQALWNEGEPQNSLWRNIKISKQHYPITMFRCTACGYLEAYAIGE
jgi:hypothetical protein